MWGCSFMQAAAMGPVKPSAKPNASATKAFPAKKVTPPRSRVVRRAARINAPAPRPARISAATRMEAHEGVLKKVANSVELPIENSSALVPFFEQLYRHQKGDMPGPVRVLHYGDSHTAADELTGSMREQFQQAFGDGGAGYSFAGRPWNGYRRLDVKTGAESDFEESLRDQQATLQGETLWYRMIAGGPTPRYLRLRPRPSISAILEMSRALPDAIEKATIEILNLRPTMCYGLAEKT